MITIYLYENIIQYKEKEEIKEFIMSPKGMKEGKIKNIPIFEENIGKLIKKEKWSTLFHSKELMVILPIHYEEIDKEILTIVLNNNGIRHIKYKKENNLIEMKKNQIIINLHHTYFTLTKKEKDKIKNYYYPLNIFPSIEEALKYVIKQSSKKCRFHFIGSNERLPKIIEKIVDQNIFYYNNFKTFLITKYIP